MRKIADFEIVRELGRGGMGVVYEAIENPLGRRVALKLLHPVWAARQDISARFVDEARKIARLSHESIVKIHRFGQVDDICYLALEFVDGTSLDTVLTRDRFSTGQAVAILLAISNALGHAHEAGIVHRDIKPGNVFLRKDGTVVLGDFGLAKDLSPGLPGLTQEGDLMGTPAYMSPEQVGGETITPASDVYSLGIMAFEFFTGRVPFTADTSIALLMKHIKESPPSIMDLVPGTPQSIVELIGEMLEKNPANRPQNGKELARRLTAIQKELESVEGETEIVQVKDRRPSEEASSLDEIEVTVACFQLVGFSRDTCQNLLPARVAFLLESWYRLAFQAVYENGGNVDRYVGDKVTCIFGYPQHQLDHVPRALRAAKALNKALSDFNQAHDLQLRMRAGIACGPALVGHIAGDVAPTSVQGPILGDMTALSKSKHVEAPIRLNRAAYRRVSSLAQFTRFEEPRLGEAWATTAD